MSGKANFLFKICFLFVVVSCNISRQTSAPVFEQASIVFEPDGFYTSMRIPALVSSREGTLLAFCEGRIGSASDWADMNLIMRRSTDGGKSWGKILVLDSMKGAPVGNPTPIVDDKGNVHLLYQKDYATAYYIHSENDGLSWSRPENITATFDQFKRDYDWKVLAPGPGHGIQLNNGRLLAAVWLANSSTVTPRRRHAPSCVATIYSDDYGKTWKRGNIVSDSTAEISNPNESMAVQLSNGKVLLSIRNPSKILRRAFSESTTGIDGWSKTRFAAELFDPTCMASIVTLPATNKIAPILFVNPDSRDIETHPRKNLTAKVSFDNGQSWPVKKVLDSGPSGYSDAAVGKDQMIYVLYETNTVSKGFNYSLVLRKFNLEWLTD
jgi:sialidase-1